MSIRLTDKEFASVRRTSRALVEAATAGSMDDFRHGAARALRTFLSAERAAFFWNEVNVTPWVSEDFPATIMADFAANAAHTDGDGLKHVVQLGAAAWTTGHLEELTGLRVLESDFGDRWFRPERLREGAGLTLNAGYRGYAELSVNVYRGKSRHGLWGARTLALLTLLEPALMAAVHVVKAFHVERRALLGMLDLLPDGVGLFDARGVWRESNARLREWISVDEELKSRILGAAATAIALQQSASSEIVERLSTRVETRSGRYLVSAIPEGTGLFAGCHTLVAVSSLDPPRMPDGVLQEQFSLTPREIQVYRLLAAGYRNADVARMLRISVHTARHHAEVVLRKTGATSRAQLATLISGPTH